jgi:hypothetical protein
MLFMLPPQYSNTFVGELDEKYNRLMEIDEPKIVVVGGSSVAFGLESEIIEEYTGMPVVNFGLYAALGTKVMLDLSKGGINEGDIVVLAPELDPQTMSMYFSSETALQAIDDQPSMIFSLDINNVFSVIGAMFKHVGQKLEYMRDGAPNPSGVYNSKNFNEYGDLEYDRPENAMALNNWAYYSSLANDDLPLALELSTRACELEATNATYLDTKAWILHLMGRDQEAKKVMQQAISLDNSSDPTLLLHYADILVANGDSFLAEIYYKRAAEAGMDDQLIRARLENLKKQR